MKAASIAGLLAALALTLPTDAATFTVDLATPLKPVDHAASGALYGIAARHRRARLAA